MSGVKKIKMPKLPRQNSQFGPVLMLLAAIAAGFVGGFIGGGRMGSSALNGSSSEVRQQIVSSESEVITEIASEVGPSVVSVNVTSQGVEQDFFGYGRPVQQESAGTGIIISADGLIITNRHVVPASATTVSVTLSDGTELDKVDVVGRTSEGDSLDVAFLKVTDKKGKELKPAKIGDSSLVKVGDKVVAIGNALGRFQNTVTSGIISGFGRDVEVSDGGSTESLVNLFQTDTAINQGNSGGPLVNMNGEVIGINTAAAAGSSENIGFAIPINDAQGLIKSVTEKGKLERPYLGVRYISLTDDYAYEYNLPVDRGAYIAPSRQGPSIIPGSPAEKAGLKEKDIIIKINDTPIDERNSLVSVLGRHTVGETVKVTIMRDAKEQTVDLKLEAAPQQP